MKTISSRLSILAMLLALAMFGESCSGDGWTRNMGVVGTGNAGRVRVTVRPGQKDITRSGVVILLRQSDTLPVEVDSCEMTLDSACHFSPDSSGNYRMELWVAGRITGRSGWFHLSHSDLDFALDLSTPQALRFRFAGSANTATDSVVLGSRRHAARFLDSGWSAENLPDSSENLWIHHAAGPSKGWHQVALTFSKGLPVCGTSLGCTATLPFVLDASDAVWMDAAIIGIPGSSGATHDNLVYGGDTAAGLGGAWDGSTVGRTLWKVALPAIASGKMVLSARLVWNPAYWGLRPTGGRDFILQGFRMRRSWNESSAGYGTVNSAAVNGATALDASWGNPWNHPLVGLDDTDADSKVTIQDTLPYLSLAPFWLDARAIVQGWLSNPASNFGMVVRDFNESSGNYLDYPAFWMHEAREPLDRPRLILELSP
jgi:hypothetical protein